MKSFLLIVLFALTSSGIFLLSSMSRNSASFSDSEMLSSFQPTTDTLKKAAFLVLETKCNECHSKKKPTYIFTKENMNGFANDIYKQVFDKGKMPKGKENKLTEEERNRLYDWLSSR